MDTSSVIGIIGILIGVCGLVFVALLARSMRSVSDSHRSGIADAEPAMVLPVERRKELVEASAGQTVTLLGEPERAVRASVTLHEMVQRGEQSPWEKSGNASKILELAGGVFMRDGRLPVNLSGGLIGLGHPVGATNIAQAGWIFKQLTGQAGAAQIDMSNKPKRAALKGMGGPGDCYCYGAVFEF